ncbi:MAG: FtsX-like permease family protein [Patescibacteria group bacterium]
MFKNAVKSLLARKLRVLLTSFAIVLGVSFISGTYIFTDSIGRTFDGLFSEVFQGVDLTVRPSAAEFGDEDRAVNPELLQQIQAINGVEVAEPGIEGYAQLIDAEGNAIGGQGPPTFGFSWGDDPTLNPLNIPEGNGRAPAGPSEVVLDVATADNNNLGIGDRIDIATDIGIENFEIVGLAKFGDANGLAGATLSLFEFSEAQRLLDSADGYSEISIRYSGDVSAEEVRTSVESILPGELEAVTGEQQASEQVDDINEGLGFINTALLAFALISIFVGSYIIQNTFRIIVTQRSKELALLRAVGATKNQVIRLVTYEALIIGIIASLIGIGLGAVIAELIRAVFGAAGASLPDGSFVIELRTIIVSLAVGIAVTVLSALLPARKASSVSPIEAMKDSEVSGSSKKPLFLRGLLGFAISIIGIALLLYGLNRSGLKNPIYYVGAGALVLFIGITVIAPLLAKPIALFVGWPIAAARGMAARLGMRNVAREPRRTASSAAALMIGVSLVVLVSIMASSFKGTIDTVLTESFPADLIFTSENIGDNGPGTDGFSVRLAQDLAELPELQDVSSVRYRIDGAKIDNEIRFIAGIDPDTFGSSFLLKPTDNAYESLGLNEIVIFEERLKTENWEVGDTIPIEFPNSGVIETTIVGSFSEPFDTSYLISNEMLLANSTDDSLTLATAKYAAGVDPDEARAAADGVASSYGAIKVQDQTELIADARNQIDQILQLLWSLLGFAVIIAVLGITNTLALSISERTREIGMLRSIGMTRRQVRRMIRTESIIIALFGAILGVAIGLFFGWALIRALSSEGIDELVIPIGQIVGFFIIAAIAGVIAAALPAWRASRMDVLDAISHE